MLRRIAIPSPQAQAKLASFDLLAGKAPPAPLERTTLRLAFATAERAATIKQLLEEAKTRQMSTSV